ncbi:MAG: DUF4390 domain-containing protein [Burkholderiaceae bacterium]|jgi:hypothetical protein|nr:DUF4390 domain-containing protein [Betaproteobacteria bacterium]MBP7780425.1 DUF4390 domain-containing protein [Burkholderiaceae bacterium]
MSWPRQALIQFFIFPCFLVLLVLPGARAESVAADATPFVLERNDDGVFLSTTVSFELPSVVDDVLRKGIPVHFVAEADLLRDRWYWTDKRVARTTRHMRLAYQTLVRRWKLQVGSTPIGNNGLGVTLSQNFESLGDALTAIQRFSRWRIASASDIDPDAKYNIDFSFRLDVAQLPRPFQIGVAGQTEWSIAVSRNQKLLGDFGKSESVKSDPAKAEPAKVESTGK